MKKFGFSTMTLNLIIITLCFMSLEITKAAGGIHSFDLKMDYSNIGLTSMYELTFQLETNQLDFERDGLRVSFPHPIHNPVKSLESQLISVTLTTLTSSNSNVPSSSQVSASQTRYDSNGRYYFYFGESLSKGVKYSLKIQVIPLGAAIQSALLTSEVVVELDSIVDYTSDDTLLYDFNAAFAALKYTAAPERNLQFSADATVSDFAFKPGGLYPLFFTIVTSKSYYGQMRFEISFIPEEGFTFSQFCYSMKDSLVQALEPSQYSCNFSDEGTLVFDYFSSYIPSGFAFRLATMAENDSRVVKNIGFRLRAVLTEASHVTDEVTLSNLFDLEQIYLTKTETTVGFGIPLDSLISPNFPICLMRLSDPSLGYSSVFNSIRFIFQVSEDTPVPSQDDNSYVLLHSISENLPNVSENLSVSCSIMNNLQNTTNRYIKCINVGQLSQNIDYHIGFRMMLGYDALQPNLPNDFSELKILTISTLNGQRIVDDTPLNVQQQIVKNTVRTLNSNNWSYRSYNQTVVSTQTQDPITQSAQFKRPYEQGGTLGIVTSNVSQKMIFSLDINNADLTNANMTIPQDVLGGAGVVIIMNPLIQLSRDSSVSSYSMLNANISSSILSTSNYFSSLKVWGTTTESLGKLFSRNDFSVSNVIIPFRSTSHVSEMTLDFYIISYDQITSNSPVQLSQILVNAYTIDTFSTTTSSIQLSILNYYTSQNSGNIPNLLPTLLKIAIQLQAEDLPSQDSAGLAIFFDGAQFVIPDEIQDGQHDETLPVNIQCGNEISSSTVQFTAWPTFQGNSTNPVNHGLIFHNMNRLLISNITLAANQWISFVLPIQLRNISTEFHVYATTLQLNSAYKQFSKTSFFSFNKIYRLSSSSMNLIEQDPAHRRLLFDQNLQTIDGFPNAQNFPDISSANMQLNMDNLRVGDTGKVSITISFTDSSNLYNYKNDNEKTFLQGSSFTLVTSWQFYSNQASQQGCVFFSIQPITQTQSTRYIMSCPLNSDNTSNIEISLAGFVMPSTALETPSDTVFAVSNSKGYLRIALAVQQSIKLPNLLKTTLTQSKLFWGSQDNLLVYGVSQPSSQIQFQKGMKIRLIPSFSQPYIIPGQQCVFVDSATSQREYGCRLVIDPAFGYYDFVLDPENCNICQFNGSFQILHYANTVIQVTSLGSNNLNDKAFAMSLCIDLLNGNCQPLATTTTPLTNYVFEDPSVTSPSKLSMKLQENSMQFLPLTHNQAGRLDMFFGFSSSKTNYIDFNGNIFNRIIVDLGTLGLNNLQIFNPITVSRYCTVYENNPETQNQMSNSFSSIQVRKSSKSNNVYSLLLSLKRDLQDVSEFILSCSDILLHHSQTILPIKLQIFDFNYLNLIDQSMQSFLAQQFETPSTNTFSFGYPFMSQIRSSSPAVLSSITFTLKTSQFSEISSNTILFLRCPHNFDLEVDNSNSFPISCSVSSVKVDCFVEQRNYLRIISIPKQISSIFKVTIAGMRVPRNYNKQIFSFKLIFNNNVPENYQEGYAVLVLSDSSVQEIYQPLIVNSMNIDSLLLNQLATYQFYISVNQTYLTPENSFQINFPSIWRIQDDDDTQSQCVIKDVASDSVLGQFCRKEGNMINLKVFTNLSQILGISSTSGSLANIQLTITNLNNPEIWDSVEFTKPSISLISDVSGRTLCFGDSFLVNVEKPSFYNQLGKVQLAWFNDQNQQISEISVTSGIFSGVAYLKTLNMTPLKGPLTIVMTTSSQIKLRMYPQEASSGIGDDALAIFIGGNINTLEGDYIATFNKIVDSFNLYLNIPSLRVLVSRSKMAIPFSVLKVKLPKSGYSPPIIIDLSSQRVMSPIVIQPVSDERIEVIQGSAMYFDTYTPKQIFLFKVSDTVQDAAISIQFTLSGSGSQFMSSDEVLSVEIDTLYYQGTTLSISEDLTKANPTSFGINFICNNPGIIFYRFSDKQEPAASIQLIQEKAILQTQEIEDGYLLKSSYGFASSSQVKTISVSVSGLLATTSYKVEAFCQTFKGDSSSKQTLLFQTTDNLAKLAQISLNFNSSLSLLETRKLSCALSDFLTIPSNLVYFRDSTKCKLSQMRTQFIKSIPKQSEPNSTELVLYIAPLLYLQDISSFDSIIAAIQDTDNLNTALQVLLPNFKQILSASQVTYLNYSPVTFNLTIPDVITPFNDHVLISNLQLNQNGFVYVALEELSGMSIKPTVSQLKRGVNFQGTVFQHGMQVSYQNLKLFEPSVFRFSSLTNGTQYIIYFLGSSEHQDDLSTFTEVFTREFITTGGSIVSMITENSETISLRLRCLQNTIMLILIALMVLS